MGVLQRVERKLEEMVGNTFARLFKGKVHPAEIGRALQREADEQRIVVGAGRVLVPNRYRVSLSPSDYDNLQEWESQLTGTLAEMVSEYSTSEGWSTFGRVVVTFHREHALRTGVFEVNSEVDPDAGPGRSVDLSKRVVPHPEYDSGDPPRPGNGLPPVPITGPAPYPPPPGPPVPAPVRAIHHALIVDGPNARHVLVEGPNVIGRGQDARVRLPDTGVSRRHLDITVAGDVATANDLGSTNGTIVNGHRIAQHALNDGDVIRIGHSVLVYRSVAQ